MNLTLSPPFTVTAAMLNLVSEISILIGRLEGLHDSKPSPQLRRLNKIKTIQGSLAIEGNTLNIDQITTILEGKRVIGKKKEILEVQNAIEAYEQLSQFDPVSIRSFLEAHRTMMKGLVDSAGKLRQRSVGILKGRNVSHIAPKYLLVPKLMNELFSFLKSNRNQNPLIISSVFHYEIEFIHPFDDGNGRIGRLWQTLILSKFRPVFEYVPIESLIKDHQKAYYLALEKSDKNGNSNEFILFMLEIVFKALSAYFTELKPARLTQKTRIEIAAGIFRGSEFGRKEYLNIFKNVSTSTASRDLREGVRDKTLKKTGSKRLTKYQFNTIFHRAPKPDN